MQRQQEEWGVNKASLQMFGPSLWSRLNISTSIGWIALTFCSDIHAFQRMYPTDIGDAFDFSSSVTMSLTNVVLNELPTNGWIAMT